ncbi:MAG: phosphatidylglycerophosphatase A family protein [Pseudomonadota bacterium]
MSRTAKSPAEQRPAPPSSRLLRDPGHALALGLGSGLSPKAPGTFGTVAALLLWWPLSQLSLVGYLVATLVVVVAGIGICGRTGRALGVADHPAIVWDEVAGLLIALVAVPAGWYWVLAGFLLFRLFDIVKPPPVGWLDRNLPGGLGVMADDVAAGLLALAVLQILAWGVGV